MNIRLRSGTQTEIVRYIGCFFCCVISTDWLSVSTEVRQCGNDLF